jgi:hypothetical protein
MGRTGEILRYFWTISLSLIMMGCCRGITGVLLVALAREAENADLWDNLKMDKSVWHASMHLF